MVRSVIEVYFCLCVPRAITALNTEVVWFDKHTAIDNTVRYCSKESVNDRKAHSFWIILVSIIIIIIIIITTLIMVILIDMV
jgi:hypothetical protein